MSQTSSTSLSERSSDSLDTNDEGSWPPKRDLAQRQLSLDEWERYLDEKVCAIRRCLYWYPKTPLESNTELWSKMNSCKKSFVQWGGLAWDIEVALQGEERKAWSEMATNMVDRITQIPEFEMLGNVLSQIYLDWPLVDFLWDQWVASLKAQPLPGVFSGVYFERSRSSSVQETTDDVAFDIPTGILSSCWPRTITVAFREPSSHISKVLDSQSGEQQG
ncbi:hypothetical protein NliqN6_0204 [Naganishia liquefaciens]|uniref:Uncharacterized protein n=1 Tax=Naganishia liquefaciens TaxID=104408 RepID=A0A8H3YD05_9TREE|nr:hypothetical protein NliqN6_0204 [Naganishia liquefaciens]